MGVILHLGRLVGAYLKPLTVKSLKRAEVAPVSGCDAGDALDSAPRATYSRTLVNGCGCAALEVAAAFGAASRGEYGPIISLARMVSHDGFHVPTVVHDLPSRLTSPVHSDPATLMRR